MTTTVFRYNAQNKLVRIEGEGFTNEFVYDSASRRIGVRRNTDEYRLDIHEGNVCIASVRNGILEQFFVRGAGIAEGTGDVIAEIIPANSSYEAHFYVANHRGDTVMTLDSSGTPECYLQYDAFGNPVSSIQYQGSFQPRYTFSTKEYLSDAKLYLYAYRVYDPVAGRWTQRDPIDYQDSVNLYQFCGNNPVNGVDPLGLADIDLKGGEEKADPRNKAITIEAHGRGGNYYDTRGRLPKIVTPEAMAAKVKAIPNYNEKKTVLDNSCSAGKEGGTAQELSKHMPNPVKGFTEQTISLTPDRRCSGLTTPDLGKEVYEVTYQNGKEISRVLVNGGINDQNKVPSRAVSQ